MAKAKVKAEGIEKFIKAVEKSRDEIINTESDIAKEVAQFQAEAGKKLSVLDDLNAQCDIAISQLNRKINQRKKQLEEVRNKLANTPKTVQYSVHNSDGSVSTQIEPNPYYNDLMRSVYALESIIRELEDKIEFAKDCIREISEKIDIINNNLNIIEEIYRESTKIYPQMYDKFERCYTLSTKALNLVNDYMALKLVLSSTAPDIDNWGYMPNNQINEPEKPSQFTSNPEEIRRDLQKNNVQSEEATPQMNFENQNIDLNEPEKKKEKKVLKPIKKVYGEAMRCLQTLCYKMGCKNKGEVKALIAKYKPVMDALTLAYYTGMIMVEKNPSIQSELFEDHILKWMNKDFSAYEYKRIKAEVEGMTQPEFDNRYGLYTHLYIKEMKKMIQNSDVLFDENSEFMMGLRERNTLFVDQDFTNEINTEYTIYLDNLDK